MSGARYSDLHRNARTFWTFMIHDIPAKAFSRDTGTVAFWDVGPDNDR